MGYISIDEEDERLYNLYAKAIEIAAHYHKGALDKGGNPYIEHPMRVSNRCCSIKEKIVAWLHDVVEDTECTLDELRELGFPNEILTAVNAITRVSNRKQNEQYAHFIVRCKHNEIAREVKIADIKDNLDLSRLQYELSEKNIERMKKYCTALAYLEDRIDIEVLMEELKGL